MRPGMPPGRKHFRRSRDAPILTHSRKSAEMGPYGKGLLAVLSHVKELLLSLLEHRNTFLI